VLTAGGAASRERVVDDHLADSLEGRGLIRGGIDHEHTWKLPSPA
jgi:hypothetical protein